MKIGDLFELRIKSLEIKQNILNARKSEFCPNTFLYQTILLNISLMDLEISLLKNLIGIK